ncbi:unnamed protein product, partial [Effrenium voratum]
SCSSTDGYAGHGVDHADCGPPGKRLDQAAEGFLLMCKIFDNFNIMITQLWGSSMAEAFAQAITMHMMKILDPATVLTEDGKSSRQLCETDTASEFPYEVYVLLDICKMQLTSAKVDGPWHRAWIETLRAIAVRNINQRAMTCIPTL